MALCSYCFEEKGTGTQCHRCGYDEESVGGQQGPELPPATRLIEGKYLVGRVLGVGGFGITYLGYDSRLKVKVAVKEFFPRHLVTRVAGSSTVRPHDEKAAEEFAEGLRRFLREAQTAARLDSHPHVVPVKDFFEENGTAYIVMGYIDGQSLADYLERQPGKRLPFRKALDIFLPILDALESIHRAKLLHRDVSPENIYLTVDGLVKLLDFGAARPTMTKGDASATVSIKEGYAPVEQYSKKGRQGPWTDIYATAAALYRTLTGTMPPASLERLSHDTLVPPSRLESDIPARAERALLKALALHPEDRYQQVSVFRREMAAAAQRNVLTMLTADRRIPALVVIMVLAALLGIKLYLDSNRREEIPPEAMRFIGKDAEGNPIPHAEVRNQTDPAKPLRESVSTPKKKKKKQPAVGKTSSPKGVAVTVSPEEEEEEEETPPPGNARNVQPADKVLFVKPNAPRGDPADLFRQGLGFERAGNRRKAFEYYEAACDQKYAVACYQAAKTASDQRLFTTSRLLFAQECKEGKAYACTNYGIMLANGEGGAKDAAKARETLEHACGLKQTVACLRLAGLWEKGEGGVDDPSVAARYYKQACELNAKEGCRRYADLLAAGKTTEKDGKKAATYYYWRACSLGDASSCQKQSSTGGKKK